MSRSIYGIAVSVVVGLLLSLGALRAQQILTYNTTLFDTLNPDPTGRYSALWGYTAPDGREYALLGGFSGTYIVDITTKPIREVAFIPGPPNGWREIKTWGHYAYVVSEGGAGLQIIDLIGLPLTASLVRSDSSVFRTGHTISQEGKWVYVHGSNPEAGANRGTLIFNVADDPEHPRLVGRYGRGYVHDAHIRNDTMYAAMINDGRLDIVYLGADRTEPQFVTDIVYPGAGTHNADVTIDGRYILTTDEVGETDKTLKVWDRADIGDIVKVKDWTPDENAIIHNVHIRGTVAYISWYTAGTRIVDIADPLNPVEIGFYDMFSGTGMRYAGNWGVYPYFESGKVISSDMSTGLHVFTFDGAKKGIADGIVKDAVSGNPIPGAQVNMPGLGRTIVTDMEGRFRILAAEGTVEFLASAKDYKAKSGSFALSSDGTQVQILLEPLQLRDVRIAVIDDESGAEIERFAFEVRTRGETIADPNAPAVLHLPADSGYNVHVGAWGWLPADVRIDPNVAGDVQVRLKRGYADDAELDLGWSLGQPDDDGVGGVWERGVPVGVSVDLGGGSLPITVEPNADHTEGIGMKAFMTKIIDSPETAPGFADVDSGRVTLTSPPFDLSRYSDPSISFALWYSNDALPLFPADDKLYVRLSNDGGARWVDVLTLEQGLTDWQMQAVRVADFLQPTSTMLFRIVAADSGEQGWVEAGLDDFRVVGDIMTGVREDEVGTANAQLSVVPNPARDVVSFTMNLSTPQRNAQLALFDLPGRQVALLHNGIVSSGTMQVDFNAADIPEGNYLWRLTFDDGSVLAGVMQVVR